MLHFPDLEISVLFNDACFCVSHIVFFYRLFVGLWTFVYIL